MGLGTAAASASVGSLALGSALAGGATAGINSILGGASASKEYEYTRRLQKHDQQFQRDMRDTAYQSMVGDMQKAGINPAVALSGGAGQVMGGSSSASAPNVNYGQVDLANIMQAMGANAITQAQKENIESQTSLNEATAGVKNKETKKIEAETKEIEAKIKNAEKQFQILDNEEKRQVIELARAYETAESDKEKAKLEAKFYNTGFGRAMRYTGLTLSAILPILGPIGGALKKPSGGITINN